MRLLVVRHGRTDWNDLKKVQGLADIELNETGKMQAKEVAKSLEDEIGRASCRERVCLYV